MRHGHLVPRSRLLAAFGHLEGSSYECDFHLNRLKEGATTTTGGTGTGTGTTTATARNRRLAHMRSSLEPAGYFHEDALRRREPLLFEIDQQIELLGGYSSREIDDIANLAWLAHGSPGFVWGVGHVAGNETKAMADAFHAGDHATALAIFTRLLPAIDAVMGVANYGATTAKAGLQLLGVLDNRRVRGPLVALDDDEVAALRQGLAASGLLS